MAKASRRWCSARAAPPGGTATRNAPSADVQYIHELGLHSGVGVPIVVDGRLWGAANVASSRPEPLPPDTEARVGDFADLVATAIANADARTELTASRARIVAASDAARRRFERDLHDGAQQRLVSLGLQLRTAEASLPPECHALRAQVSDVVTGSDGRIGRSPRDIPRDSSGNSFERWTWPSAEDAGPSLCRPGGASPRHRPTVARLCRSGRLLRCRGSAHERGEVRTSVRGGG